METAEILAQQRRILDCIHELGNIFYDAARYDAYRLVALTASTLRTERKP